MCMHAQSCPTLCNPMDCSTPSSSVHGISHVRILEWVAISFSRRSFWPRIEPMPPAIGKHWPVDSQLLSHLGSPPKGILVQEKLALLIQPRLPPPTLTQPDKKGRTSFAPFSGEGFTTFCPFLWRRRIQTLSTRMIDI